MSVQLEGWAERSVAELAEVLERHVEANPDELHAIAREVLALVVRGGSTVGDLIRVQTLQAAAADIKPNPARWARGHGLYRAQDVAHWLRLCADLWTAQHATPEDITDLPPAGG